MAEEKPILYCLAFDVAQRARLSLGRKRLQRAVGVDRSWRTEPRYRNGESGDLC